VRLAARAHSHVAGPHAFDPERAVGAGGRRRAEAVGQRQAGVLGHHHLERAAAAAGADAAARDRFAGRVA